ncbi:hypothetical protein AALA00_10515 [Lachnospiraceae bacterium 46-15]
MDAKSKANFINSVGGGQQVPCPGCGALNKADSRFCITCGTPMQQMTASSAAQPVPVAEPEEVSVFAEGLPSWDIVPPQVVVRRKKKR